METRSKSQQKDKMEKMKCVRRLKTKANVYRRITSKSIYIPI